MDLTRTTDHIQSRPGLSNQNTAPRDLSQPITNLSEVKGAAQARGRAKATDTLPPSLIARMTQGVIVAQRRRIANQPASSRDTRMAEHHKASHVLEDRGGATAPGAELSLRPTGKAAGGVDDIAADETLGELRDGLDASPAISTEDATSKQTQSSGWKQSRVFGMNFRQAAKGKLAEVTGAYDPKQEVWDWQQQVQSSGSDHEKTASEVQSTRTSVATTRTTYTNGKPTDTTTINYTD